MRSGYIPKIENGIGIHYRLSVGRRPAAYPLSHANAGVGQRSRVFPKGVSRNELISGLVVDEKNKGGYWDAAAKVG